MAKQGESRLQRQIRARLEAEFPGSWWVKYHGGPFMRAGVPDLLGCVQGRLFAFEVKREDQVASRIQRKTIARLRRAGAISQVIYSAEEAIDAIREALSLSDDGS